MLPDSVLVPLTLIAPFYFVENVWERGLTFTHDSGSSEKNYIIEAGGRQQTAELYSSDSFLSQSSAVLHFGLG